MLAWQWYALWHCTIHCGLLRLVVRAGLGRAVMDSALVDDVLPAPSATTTVATRELLEFPGPMALDPAWPVTAPVGERTVEVVKMISRVCATISAVENCQAFQRLGSISTGSQRRGPASSSPLCVWRGPRVRFRASPGAFTT